MKIIEILVGPLLLLIWLIINTIYWVKRFKNLVSETNKDMELVIKYENC